MKGNFAPTFRALRFHSLVRSFHGGGGLLAGYKVLQCFRAKLEFKNVFILQIRTAGEYLSIWMIDRTLGLSV